MLTLEQSKKFFWPITIVVLIAVFALTLFLVFLPKKSTAPKTISRAQFISKLPYYTKDFTIVYSKNKNQIYVNIINPPYDINRQKAGDWIRQNGQNPQNLQIIYAPRSIFKNLNPK